MEIPLSLTVSRIEPPAEIESLIRERAARLERFYRPIIHCEVFLDGPVRHHRTGGPYGVRVVLRVPGAELAVAREQEEDLAAAVHAAFDAARRRLEDYARRQRADVKTHAVQPRGRVVRLFSDEGYGFLVTADDREVFFQAASVLSPGFDRLAVGSEVRFVEERGDEGPQASTVEIVADAPPPAAEARP